MDENSLGDKLEFVELFVFPPGSTGADGYVSDGPIS